MIVKAIPRLKIYSFLFSMPIIDVAINQILYRERLWSEWEIWVISFPLVFLLGCFSWLMRITASAAAERRYPELNQTWKRLRSKMLVCCISMVTSVITVLAVYSLFNILEYSFRFSDIWQGAILAFCVNVIFETLYDAEYAISKYRQAEEEKELLRQQSFTAEFDSLKNQVNPHFLFNCFNTVSSLIREDKVTAIQFLDELSKVYRYLLKNNEEGISTVAAEMRFVHSYFQLLQTRYGEAVSLIVQTDPDFDQFLLPSLSLQLLIENAVKHNILSRAAPLQIEIFIAAGNPCLVVRNNIQRRHVKAPSNRIGLRNIQMKYELLNHEGFSIHQGEEYFSVNLPLINPYGETIKAP
ncbi:MAG: histidine kinase [Chitinophagaceae bacterium]